MPVSTVSGTDSSAAPSITFLTSAALSTSDRWTDVTQKLREYFDIGVRLVWIVDPEAQRIYAYRSLTEVQEFTEKDELSGDEVLPGFSAPVAELFEI